MEETIQYYLIWNRNRALQVGIGIRQRHAKQKGAPQPRLLIHDLLAPWELTPRAPAPYSYS